MRIVPVFEFAQERVMTSQSQRLRCGCVKLDEGMCALPLESGRLCSVGRFLLFQTVALSLG